MNTNNLENIIQVNLGEYAKKAYFEYAAYVVKERALPQIEDGLKPVHRRLLFSIFKMNMTPQSKPVKSARIVGNVIGQYHPHGDSSVYEAMVRTAQDFSLRYPLIDGQGNFGTRDGDPYAAHRYTEAKPSKFTNLFLEDLDDSIVDYTENFDGTLLEPKFLPARMPMGLLNGQSGIAVGMATEIPSHNLTEVGNALIYLLECENKSKEINIEEIINFIPAPDFPTGAKVINSPAEIKQFYIDGKGSFKLRSTYRIEELDKKNYRIIIESLPYGVSTAKILFELEEIANPKLKNGKKKLEDSQVVLKNIFNTLIEKVRDNSDEKDPIQIIIDPKNKNIDALEIMQFLYQNTSMQFNFSMNMTMIGINGKPKQKGLLSVLTEFLTFRKITYVRKITNRLIKIDARMNILNGRVKALSMINEIISIIQHNDDPKKDLLALNFNEIQVEDILGMKLRSLANTDFIKLQKEIDALNNESNEIKSILNDHKKINIEIIKILKSDIKEYGDERRTLVSFEENKTINFEEKNKSKNAEDCTVIISKNGFIRYKTGLNIDMSKIDFKIGDELKTTFECQTNDTLAVLDNNGTIYNINLEEIPDARSAGKAISSMIDIKDAEIQFLTAIKENEKYFVSSTEGYAFICFGKDLMSRSKQGKAFLTVDSEKNILNNTVSCLKHIQENEKFVYYETNKNRKLIFTLEEVKILPRGKGVMILNGEENELLSNLSLLNEQDIIKYEKKYFGKRVAKPKK